MGRIGLLLLVFVSGLGRADDGFMIQRAEVQRRGTDYVLNADIAYRFSPEALEALDNGVPLTIVLQWTIERERTYWWNQQLVADRRKLEIRYHPLGQLYQMSTEESADPQRYASLRALLSALGTIRGLPIVTEDRLEPGASYLISLGVSLDIESLPLPLRPTAYLTPGWHLSSPAYRWSFARSE
jgi:Domain of unknown function (DUF4390)